MQCKLNMGLKASLTWETDAGRELIRLKEGATSATVVVSECDSRTLRELSRVALEAAEQIEAYAADAVEVYGAKPK